MPRGKPKRNSKGQWKKGYSGNPEGKSAPSTLSELQKAMRKVSKEKGMNLAEHFVRRAYVSDKVLKSIFKKLLPDLKSVDARLLLQGGVNLNHLTDRQLDEKIDRLMGNLNASANSDSDSDSGGKRHKRRPSVVVKRKKHKKG